MICLTFDTDYMQPNDMNRFLHEYQLPGRGTFFLWNEMKGVDWKGHELGPHPFFEQNKGYSEILEQFEAFVGCPCAGMRSHSCLTSHMLEIELKKRKYIYCSNKSALFQDNLSPLRLPWGIWELPIYYMDSMDFTMPEGWSCYKHKVFDKRIIEQAVGGDALYVFDFHPLHIILNTNDRQQYAGIKNKLLKERVSPYTLSFSGYGTRDFFEFLLQSMMSNAVESTSCHKSIPPMQA